MSDRKNVWARTAVMRTLATAPSVPPGSDAELQKGSYARLRIHALRRVHHDNALRHALFRWVALGRDAEPPALPTCVHVADLQGREVRIVTSRDPVIELSLAPGTYDVTIGLGKMRCRYTIALASGGSCDLQPKFAHAQS